jgi:hypothetical protein
LPYNTVRETLNKGLKMSSNIFKFKNIEMAGKFTAELMRQGIRFDGHENAEGGITIELLGY